MFLVRSWVLVDGGITANQDGSLMIFNHKILRVFGLGFLGDRCLDNRTRLLLVCLIWVIYSEIWVIYATYFVLSINLVV